MRTLLASALFVSVLLALSVTSGCLPLGCGGFSGGGDKVYGRGSDMLILCENGGFVAMTAQQGTIEGLYHPDPSDPNGFGTRGDDGDLAFDLTDNGDGSATTPQFGTAPWQLEDLTPTALDHANVLCTDLTTRTWWTQQ